MLVAGGQVLRRTTATTSGATPSRTSRSSAGPSTRARTAPGRRSRTPPEVRPLRRSLRGFATPSRSTAAPAVRGPVRPSEHAGQAPRRSSVAQAADRVEDLRPDRVAMWSALMSSSFTRSTSGPATPALGSDRSGAPALPPAAFRRAGRWRGHAGSRAPRRPGSPRRCRSRRRPRGPCAWTASVCRPDLLHQRRDVRVRDRLEAERREQLQMQRHRGDPLVARITRLTRIRWSSTACAKWYVGSRSDWSETSG